MGNYKDNRGLKISMKQNHREESIKDRNEQRKMGMPER